MASSSEAVPLAAPAQDLEQGKEAEPLAEGPEYYVIYCFSSLLLIVGTWAAFFPFAEGHFVGAIMGSGGLVLGAFNILSVDPLVSYLRLRRERRQLAAEGEKFRESLAEQKKEIRSLQQIAKHLETAQGRLHRSLEDLDALQGKGSGLLQELQEELDDLSTLARDATRRNMDGMLLVGKFQEITPQRLQTVYRAFSNCYVRIFPSLDARLEEVRRGLEDSPRWKQFGSVSDNRLKFILTGVLFEDIEDIREWTRSRVEAETDEAAASLSFRRPQGQAPSKDPWAEAMAFAGVQE